jgi:hypothetical protein
MCGTGMAAVARMHPGLAPDLSGLWFRTPPRGHYGGATDQMRRLFFWCCSQVMKPLPSTRSLTSKVT